MLAMVSAAFPVLLSVRVWAELVTPSVCNGNVKELGDSPAAGALPVVPVPARVTVWVEPVLPELSMICKLAENELADAGVKVTEMEQLAFAARLDPQVVVSAKSLGFAPPITMLEMDSGPDPVLLRVTVCAAEVLPEVAVNVRLDGLTAATGTPMPVPLSEALWVEPATLPALSVTVKIPVRVPGALGVKVTEMVQLDPMATEPEQLLVVA